MSPRAAWRLESLGFTRVYDYVAGKADWGSFGLPLEGTLGPRAGDYVGIDVPTCELAERLQDVRRRVGADWDTCIVVNAVGVVVDRMQTQKLTNALVTRSDGTPVGVLRRADAEAALDAATADAAESSNR